MLAPLSLTLAWATVAYFSGLGGPSGFVLLLIGLLFLPVIALRTFRRSVGKRHVLVRASGRVLLDGEPLEVARVELRVVKHWLLRRPQGYALSLWALVGRGDPTDLELGRFSSMLEATSLSGQMEDFLERAKARATGRAPTGD